MNLSEIAIIYNPKSTGDGKRLAAQLETELKGCIPRQKVSVHATKGAGHAELLAYTLAKASGSPLIVSVSGDGGYHEVVNGLMRAQDEGAKPIAGLLPAGNANDHHRNVKRNNFITDICVGNVQTIDLLKITSHVDGKPYERYAHSYIGVGAEAELAAQLDNIKGSVFHETIKGIRVAWRYKPVELLTAGTRAKYYGIIFSNVRTMAKIFTIAPNAKHDDGKFEVNIFEWRNRFWAMVQPFVGMVFGFHRARPVKQFKFKTTAPTIAQLDGETVTLDAAAPVIISCEHNVWHCII